jgi:hypothetical protein
MALPWDPTTGGYVQGAAMGAVSPVAPVAPIQAPLGAGVEKANAKERELANRLKQAMFKIAVLREQPLFGTGQGPLGATIGQGPGGWALTLGSALGGVLAKKHMDEAAAAANAASGNVVPAENETNAAINAERRRMLGVPQGSPLSLSDY